MRLIASRVDQFRGLNAADTIRTVAIALLTACIATWALSLVVPVYVSTAIPGSVFLVGALFCAAAAASCNALIRTLAALARCGVLWPGCAEPDALRERDLRGRIDEPQDNAHHDEGLANQDDPAERWHRPAGDELECAVARPAGRRQQCRWPPPISRRRSRYSRMTRPHRAIAPLADIVSVSTSAIRA